MKPTPADLKALKILLKDSKKEFFGPVLWHAFHNAGAKNLITEKWLDEFSEGIPCPFCRAHFDLLRAEHPLSIASSQFNWSFLIHQIVNAKINRPMFSLKEAKFVHSAD